MESVNIFTATDNDLEGTETFTLSLTSSGLNGTQISTTLSIQDGNCELLIYIIFLNNTIYNNECTHSTQLCCSVKQDNIIPYTTIQHYRNSNCCSMNNSLCSNKFCRECM